MQGEAQDRESLAGESAAQALKRSALAQSQQYNLHYGPLDLQVGAALRFGYTDNVYYSATNVVHDFLVIPEVTLGGFVQVSELNTLRFSVGLGYEYYFDNTQLNTDAPMVNPDSDLVFNLFVGNFHIRLRERFTYQQTLFFNTTPSGQDLLFNLNNVGVFTRWDNLVGFNADWDLDKVIVSAGYNHEDFVSSTAEFEYLNRASEWLTASVAYLLGDQVQTGVESQGSWHSYTSQVTLNDHWQVRAGPFVDLKLPEGLSLRVGGGYDTAQYQPVAASSDFETYYAYGRVTQETRFFTHSLSAGHEDLLGDNANNLETTYVRYSIASPVVAHVELGANASVHFDKEFGGTYAENFTYYLVGFTAAYQFHKNWRTDLSYEFLLNNSNLPDRSYNRSRVTVGVAYTF
jgi:hypothetical protein